MKIFCCLVVMLVLSTYVNAQDTLSVINYDSIPPLQVELQKDLKKDKKKKKKKGKKNIYYGHKVKKSFTRSQYYVEVFTFLKEPIKPNKYLGEVAWFSFDKRRIYKTRPNKIMKGGKILHGPYEKRRGENVVEKGFYYLGAKHGRWESYGRDAMDRDHVLIDKTTYYRGWQKDSKISYYDTGQKLLKEVIPMRFGQKDGMYYRYFKNGRLAEKGAYQDGVKIGRWMEYYESGQRMKETQHAKKSTVENFKPYVLREWSNRGKVTVHHKR